MYSLCSAKMRSIPHDMHACVFSVHKNSLLHIHRNLSLHYIYTYIVQNKGFAGSMYYDLRYQRNHMAICMYGKLEHHKTKRIVQHMQYTILTVALRSVHGDTIFCKSWLLGESGFSVRASSRQCVLSHRLGLGNCIQVCWECVDAPTALDRHAALRISVFVGSSGVMLLVRTPARIECGTTWCWALEWHHLMLSLSSSAFTLDVCLNN